MKSYKLKPGRHYATDSSPECVMTFIRYEREGNHNIACFTFFSGQPRYGLNEIKKEIGMYVWDSSLFIYHPTFTYGK